MYFFPHSSHKPIIKKTFFQTVKSIYYVQHILQDLNLLYTYFFQYLFYLFILL